jgi:hypothetical protein
MALAACSAFADDPPARVARLSYMSGEVSVQPIGVNDWVEANINRPLTSSDRIWADNDSRAELQLGGAALRLDEGTSITLVNVSDNNVQLQLDEGTASLHVAELFDGEVYEVDTPNVAFVVHKAGDYRFDVDNAGDTTAVTVFHGEGEATGDGPAIRVKSEERYTFTDARSMRYSINHNPGLDGFDQWAMARADREDRAVSAKYVSRYAVGYSDLDSYGRWETVAEYGPIWYPRTVVVDWAPYRYGHWIWVSPWGWTWVDDAPWGFAPFHYGRWVYHRNNWGWCPGPIAVRPVYAPALVAWVGGPHFGVSLGVGGGVGWFPLGWGEPFIPYYENSRGYFRNVNISNTRITNITYVTNNYYGKAHGHDWHYAYRGKLNAVTAMSNDDFRTARPTRDKFFRLHDNDLHDASVERNLPIRPTTNSVLGANAGRRGSKPPATWSHPSRPEHMPVANGQAPHQDVSPQRDSGRNNADNRDMHPTRENDRPRRDFPHPPDHSNAPATAEVEKPRDIPNPGRVSAPSNESNPMPRVPRPPDRENRPQSYGRMDRDLNSKPSDDARPTPPAEMPSRSYVPGHDNRSVPRPPEGQINRPDHHPDPAGRIEREQAPRVNEQRHVPPPEATPMRAPEARNGGVSHDMRPQTQPGREQHPAPRVEAPARHSEPPHEAPAPANKPAPQRNPGNERKVERENTSSERMFGYPRPYGAVRLASYSPSDAVRVGYANLLRSDAPRNYNRPVYNTSATRPASHSSSFSQPRPTSPSPSRMSSNTVRSPATHSSQPPSHSYSPSSRNTSSNGWASHHGQSR